MPYPADEVVSIEIRELDVDLRPRPRRGDLEVRARLEWVNPDPSKFALFDLRPKAKVRGDGLSPQAFRPTPGRPWRAVWGEKGRLRFRYTIEGVVGDDGSFALDLSDRRAGGLLERWAPAGRADTMIEALNVELHRPRGLVVTNGLHVGDKKVSWTNVRSSSPYLAVLPKSTAVFDGPKATVVDASSVEQRTLILDELEALEIAFGVRIGEKVLVHIRPEGTAMEYLDAVTTTGDQKQVAHELAHLWFGRGKLEPASGADWWLDEAIAEYWSWTRTNRTCDHDDSIDGLPGESPWSRRTPRDAYTQGACAMQMLDEFLRPFDCTLVGVLNRMYGDRTTTTLSLEGLLEHVPESCAEGAQRWIASPSPQIADGARGANQIWIGPVLVRTASGDVFAAGYRHIKDGVVHELWALEEGTNLNPEYAGAGFVQRGLSRPAAGPGDAAGFPAWAVTNLGVTAAEIEWFDHVVTEIAP